MQSQVIEGIKNRYIKQKVYWELQAEIAEKNLDTVCKLSFIGMVGGIALTILSLPPIHLLKLFWGYLSFAIIFVAIYTATRTVLKRHPRLIIPIFYIMYSFLLITGIVMGTYWGRDTNATTFVMMLFIFPLFIIDKPYHIHLISTFFSVIFMVIAIREKTGSIRSLDITNCLIFLVLSCAFSSQSIWLKIKDIQNRKELENKLKLEDALRMSEMESQAKTEFFSRMSHDMRTPMNGILGLARLSENEENVIELKENMKKIEVSGEYLLDLINDTLDFQNINNGEIKIEPRVVECGVFFDQIADIVNQAAQQAKVAFCVEKKNVDWTSLIKIDPVRMKQVLLSLMMGALKHTPENGKVIFSVECVAKEKMVTHMLFRISDTGKGMTREFIENGLFEAFTKEFDEATASYTSASLGLAVTKKMIEYMGGTIEVVSELGIGTVFLIRMSLERVDRKEKEQIQIEGEEIQKKIIQTLKGKKILVVEDYILNMEIATRILEKVGCVVYKVENGKKGLDSFEKSAPDFFDGILISIKIAK